MSPRRAPAHKGPADRTRGTESQSGPREKRVALVVLGMHRSGTSALTRVLGLLGAELPATLMPAHASNARGFFESATIFELHEKLLAEFGSSWDDLSPMTEDWERSGRGRAYVDEMARAVEQEFGDAPLFVLKDPRICRLVPFWREVLKALGAEPRFVLPVRNPLEVSASLARAHEMDQQRGRLLWLQHFLLAERETRGSPRVFVTYEQLVDDWRRTVGRIRDEVEIVLPRWSRRAEVEVDRFLTDALRNHVVPNDAVEVRADVAEWVRATHRWAERAATGGRPSPRTLDKVADAFFAAESAFGPIVAQSEHRALEQIEEVARLREAVRTHEAREAAVAQAAESAPLIERIDDVSGTVKRMLLLWLVDMQRRGLVSPQHLEDLLADVQLEPDARGDVIELAEWVSRQAGAEFEGGAESRIEALESELATARATLEAKAGTEAELAEHRSRWARLEAELEMRTRELETRASQAESTAARLAEAEAARLAAEERAQQTRLESEKRMARLEAELSEREQRSAALETERREAEARFAAARDEQESLRLELVRREHAAAEQARALESATEEAARATLLEEALDTKEIELRRYRADLRDVERLRQRVREIDQRMASLREASAAERAALAEALETRRVELETEYDRRRQEDEASRAAAIAAAEREAEGLRSALAEREADARETRARQADPRMPGGFLASPVPGRVPVVRRGGLLSLPRRIGELVWWSVTFRLPRRLRERRVAERIRRSGVFDSNYYLAMAVEGPEAIGDPVVHYVRHGAAEGRNPNAAFDSAFYLEANADVRNGNRNPLDHFLCEGAREGRRPHPFFDPRYYLADSPDVAAAGIDPLLHWLRDGWREGRLSVRIASLAGFRREWRAQHAPETGALDAARTSVPTGEPPVASSPTSIATPLPAFTPEQVPEPVTAPEASVVSLRVRFVEGGGERKAAADDPVLLVVTHELPVPPRAGNHYRIHRTVRWLEGRGYRVLVVHAPLAGAEPTDEAIRAARTAIENLLVVDRGGEIRAAVDPSLGGYCAALDGVRVGASPRLAPFEEEPDAAYRERVELEQSFCPDALGEVVRRLDASLPAGLLVLTNYVWLSRFLPDLRPETRSMIDTHDLFSSKAEKVDALGVSGELGLLPAQERGMLLRCDGVLAIQPEEAVAFRALVPERPVFVVGVDFDVSLPDESAVSDLAEGAAPVVGLIGSANAMNVKGVRDFMRHAWPLLRRDRPGIRLRIAGAVGQAVPPGLPDVEVLGTVDCLSDFYTSSHVVVNPVAAGTGLKIKTVEAIAHGRSIICWPHGVEGVPGSLRPFCPVAEDWHAFYEEVLAALEPSRLSPHAIRTQRELAAKVLAPETVYAELGDEIDRHVRAGARSLGR